MDYKKIGREVGLNEGLEKGREEGRRELILDMLKNKDISMVSEITSLSEQEIQNLLFYR